MEDYNKTVIVSDAKKLAQKMQSALFKRDAYLETENGEGIHEVVMDYSTITDTKPVHAGVAILQHSKLMLLQFVDFLRDYLIPGSFVLVYGGNIFFIILNIN